MSRGPAAPATAVGERSGQGPARGAVRAHLQRAGRALWDAGEPGVQPDAPRERRAALARDHLLPLALYLLLAVVLTLPLALHFGTHLPGDDGDAWMNYWNYWWTGRAVAGGRNPFWTPFLYAPHGVPLYLHTLNPFNGLISLPVQWAFGLTPAYNTVVLLSLTLAAYFAYLLVAFVSGSRLAGFVGGAIYAFGSYHLAHLLGHTNLLSSEWLPAFILCLLRADAATGRRRTGWVALAILALLLLALCDWQYVLFAALFTGLYAAYHALARRSAAPILIALAIGIGWGVAALPLLVATVAEIRETAATRPAVFGPERFSADLISFVIPSPLHAWWGGQAERIGGRAVAPPVERAVFLGYLPLALAAYAAWRDRRRAAFWAVAALVFAVLALGPSLQIAGRTRFGAAGWAPPLPYALLQRAPGINVSRVPGRFAVLVTLCLAVLAGIALARLGRRHGARLGPRGRVVATAVLLVVILAEHVAVPYPLTPVDAPPFYRQLAEAREAGTVLELPLVLARSRSLFYQTVHQRPLIGGYLARPLDYPLLDVPPFAELANRVGPPDITPAGTAEVGLRALAWSEVRWIVVLLEDRRLDRAALPAFLARYAEPEPIYRDARMVVYRPRPPGEPAFFVRPAGDWHATEPLPDRQARMRWMGWSAALDAWCLGDGPQPAVLSFDAGVSTRRAAWRSASTGSRWGSGRSPTRTGWRSR